MSYHAVGKKQHSCCHCTPADSDKINPSPTERVIIDFVPRACCGTSQGFPEEVQNNLPGGNLLEKAGITLEQWKSFVQDYEETVAPQSNVCGYIFLLCVAWVFFIPGMIMLFCYDYGLKSPFQKAFRSWLNRVNHSLPKGCYAKTQTLVIETGRGRIERSTLSISITEHESEILKNEPVLCTLPSLCCRDCDCIFCNALDRNRVV